MAARNVPHPHALNATDRRHPRRKALPYLLLVAAVWLWAGSVVWEEVASWHRGEVQATAQEAYDEGYRDGRAGEKYFNMLPPVRDTDVKKKHRKRHRTPD